MDLVYITQPTSQVELRYSIRSMEKHLKGIERLFIVGDCPSFIKGAIHIPAEDPHTGNPARNIAEKLLKAAKDPRVGNYFIACSDDYFLLKDFEANKFPYYHCGPLYDTIFKTGNSNYYRGHLLNTEKALMDRGLPIYNFNVHCPIVYHTDLFIDILSQYDWSIKQGYVTKSIYANTLKIPGELVTDCVIKTPKTTAAINKKINGRSFFATGDMAINEEMIAIFKYQYPAPSRWEVA